jgi:hypothetical protein
MMGFDTPYEINVLSFAMDSFIDALVDDTFVNAAEGGIGCAYHGGQHAEQAFQYGELSPHSSCVEGWQSNLLIHETRTNPILVNDGALPYHPHQLPMAPWPVLWYTPSKMIPAISFFIFLRLIF